MEKKNIYQLVNQYRGAVMGCAAIWILVFHVWNPVFGGLFFLSGIEKVTRRLGFCGVDMFLLLSGMGLTFSISRTTLGGFYYNRIKRILPPFLMVAVVRGIVEKWSLEAWIGNVTGYNFYAKSVFSFLWFVPAIVTFYLCFPLYYYVFKKASDKKLFTGCMILIWLFLSLWFRETMREDLYGFTNRIPIFLIGILMGWMAQHEPWNVSRGMIAFAVLLSMTGYYLGYLTNYADMEILVPVSNCCLPNICMSCGLTILIPVLLDFLQEKLKAAGAILCRVLSFYGIFTLEIYCLQDWMGPGMSQRCAEVMPNLAANILTIASLTAASFLFHFAIKKAGQLLGSLFHRNRQNG